MCSMYIYIYSMYIVVVYIVYRNWRNSRPEQDYAAAERSRLLEAMAKQTNDH